MMCFTGLSNESLAMIKLEESSPQYETCVCTVGEVDCMKSMKSNQVFLAGSEEIAEPNPKATMPVFISIHRLSFEDGNPVLDHHFETSLLRD